MTRNDFFSMSITLKDVLHYFIVLTSAVIFITNISNKVDNLTASVDRLYVSFEKKDLVDDRQNLRLETAEKNILIFGQILKISPFQSP